MRLSVTSRRPGGVGQPPASLRGTMERGSTGQTRSGNPPPACGAACARVRRSRFGVWPHGKARSAQPVGSECAFPSRRDRRMRLSVRVPAQNALFRRVRLSSPGQMSGRLTEKRTLPPAPHGKMHSATYISRKGAFCGRVVTEKYILYPVTHGKAHSAIPRSRRLRLSVTSRRPGGVVQPPRQAAGHYGECLNWANALEQPPARLRGGLRECPQISVRSLTSRKSALCSRRNRNSVHKCPKTAPRGRFRRSVYTLCPHGRSRDRVVGPRVPQRRRPMAPVMPGYLDLRPTLPGRRHICAARRSSRHSLP